MLTIIVSINNGENDIPIKIERIRVYKAPLSKYNQS